MEEADLQKIQAAAAAVAMVRSGMVVGLGTGSTAGHFVRLLGDRVQRGLDVRGVPTSEATRRLAAECGVPLIEPNLTASIDLAVDGADEVDPQFSLIKGGGGALLREKIVATAASHFVIIADDSKRVERLGAFPLPVEVTPYAFTLTAGRLYGVLRAIGCPGWDVVLREDGQGRPFLTDGGNYILDCRCQFIPDPAMLAAALDGVTGVVEHGLFIGLAGTVILGGPGGVTVLER